MRSSFAVLGAPDLDSAVGGQNTTSVTTPFGSYKSSETDYSRCRTTAQQYCDTRSGNRTSLLGIDTGVSSAKSAACMKTTLPQMCGKPPK